MPRILGVDIPADKPILYSLMSLYGIGKTLSGKVLTECRIDPGVRAKNLTEDELSRIATLVERTYIV